MSNYTTQQNIEGYIKRPLSDPELRVMQTLLDAADETIRQFTNKIWTETAQQVRHYNEISGNHCEIEDAQSITKIELLDIRGNVIYTIDPTLYFFEPYNYAELGEPINSVYFPQYGYFNFPRGIQITGTWGTTKTPPSDIALAATILISDMLNNPAGATTETTEGYKVEMNKDMAVNPHLTRLLTNRGSRVFI